MFPFFCSHDRNTSSPTIRFFRVSFFFDSFCRVFFAVFIRFLFLRCLFFPDSVFLLGFFFAFFTWFFISSDLLHAFVAGPNPYAAATSICLSMRFLLQLIAKIDSPLLSHHFSHDFSFRFGFKYIDLSVTNYGWPTFLSQFCEFILILGKRKEDIECISS
jgi:hypothetical protein